VVNNFELHDASQQRTIV